MKTVRERIKALQDLMKVRGIDAYIIPTEDYHHSEYVGAHFKAREYMSGFTGSAGTLVVRENQAALWTDGRYFFQAGQQLEESGIVLMRSGQPDVPTISEYLAKELEDKCCIGMDGRCVSNTFVDGIKKKMGNKDVAFSDQEDLVDLIWEERPERSKQPIWELDAALVGKSRSDKMKAVRHKMTQEKADYLLVTALDDIAWLMNLRGNDVDYTPVFLSYLLLEQDKATLFVNKSSLSEKTQENLQKDGVVLADYQDVDHQLKQLDSNASIWMDKEQTNYHLTNCIPGEMKVVTKNSPIELMKATKTQEEQDNIKKAHIKDGVAVTRFLYWLKQKVQTETITEIDAADKLLEFRKEMEGFLDQSFEPIMAYDQHGAIIHYAATKETNATLQPRGFLLSDTGAHYKEGTTDITRTIVLGELTAEEKKAFTLVLRGNLMLGNARFVEGVCGQNLDILARQPLWEYGMDFNHGTGHGVGYILNVHEGPQRIHWRIRENMQPVPFVEGMVVSNEPGYYKDHAFGIRHENLVLCKKEEKTEYGQFLSFETLTMVPFDLEGIDVELMTQQDIDLLNAYHKKIYDTISGYLSDEERKWLEKETQPIHK